MKQMKRLLRKLVNKLQLHILTDCDDVLCAWNDVFTAYMASIGKPILKDRLDEYNLARRFDVSAEEMNEIVNWFNTSKYIETMIPLADAQTYVKKLVDLDFRFTVITSANDNPMTHFYRTKNLNALFGEKFLKELICLPMGSSKYPTLERWKNSNLLWVEDKCSNLNDGISLGLDGILVDREYNRGIPVPGAKVVSSNTPWKEIYEIALRKYNP